MFQNPNLCSARLTGIASSFGVIAFNLFLLQSGSAALVNITGTAATPGSETTSFATSAGTTTVLASTYQGVDNLTY